MLSRQPSQQWRDEARHARRDRAARASQVGWRPETNLHRGDPRVRARDGTQAGPVLQAPNMPGFNNGPAARRSNVPIVCCGLVMERDSRQFRLLKIVVTVDVLLMTLYMLVAHDSSDDGLTLLGYALIVLLTMCFAPLLIISPYIVAAICKCWYNRKINAAMQNSLMENDNQTAEDAEAARLERMRAEMALTVMSELRSGIDPVVEPGGEVGGYMGNQIVDGEVLGDIILLDKASAAKLVSALPVAPVRSASTELAANMSSGVDDDSPSTAEGVSIATHELAQPRNGAIEVLERRHSSPRSSPAARPDPVSPSRSSRQSYEGVVGPAISTGRVVQPGDWRLGHTDPPR